MIDDEIECVKVIDIGEAQESTLDKKVLLECVGSPYYMAPEVLMLKTNEKIKVIGNYIKADVYSTAISILNMYYPDVTLSKEDRKKDENEQIKILRSMMMNDILEQKIKQHCPILYSILK